MREASHEISKYNGYHGNGGVAVRNVSVEGRQMGWATY